MCTVLFLPLSHLPWEETDALAIRYSGRKGCDRGGVPFGGITAKAQFLSLALLEKAKWVMKDGNSSLPEEQTFNFDTQLLSTKNPLSRSSE